MGLGTILRNGMPASGFAPLPIGAAAPSGPMLQTAEKLVPGALNAGGGFGKSLVGWLPGEAGLGARLGGGATFALGGQLASGIWDKAVGQHSGTWDDAGSDALSGAGLGAGIGTMIGGPGIGTAIGGGLGFVGGGLYGLLFGDKKSSAQHSKEIIQEATARLGDFMSQAQLSPEARQSIHTQLMAATYNTKDPAKIAAAYDQAAQLVPQLADQEQMQRRQLTNMLATQQVLTPQFDNFLKGLGANQQAFQAANNGFADIISKNNPAAGAFLRQQGAASILSDSATAAAYKNQLGGQVQQLAGQIGAPQSITQTLMSQYG